MWFDIVEIWFGVADGQILWVMCRRHAHIFVFKLNLSKYEGILGKELNKLLCFCSNPIVVFSYVLYM